MPSYQLSKAMSLERRPNPILSDWMAPDGYFAGRLGGGASSFGFGHRSETLHRPLSHSGGASLRSPRSKVNSRKKRIVSGLKCDRSEAVAALEEAILTYLPPASRLAATSCRIALAPRMKAPPTASVTVTGWLV